MCSLLLYVFKKILKDSNNGHRYSCLWGSAPISVYMEKHPSCWLSMVVLKLAKTDICGYAIPSGVLSYLYFLGLRRMTEYSVYSNVSLIFECIFRLRIFGICIICLVYTYFCI